MECRAKSGMAMFADIKNFENVTMDGKSIFTRAILGEAAKHFDESSGLTHRSRPMFVKHFVSDGTFCET